jgi:hypothetical protein
VTRTLAQRLRVAPVARAAPGAAAADAARRAVVAALLAWPGGDAPTADVEMALAAARRVLLAPAAGPDAAAPKPLDNGDAGGDDQDPDAVPSNSRSDDDERSLSPRQSAMEGGSDASAAGSPSRRSFAATVGGATVGGASVSGAGGSGDVRRLLQVTGAPVARVVVALAEEDQAVAPSLRGRPGTNPSSLSAPPPLGGQGVLVGTGTGLQLPARPSTGHAVAMGMPEAWGDLHAAEPEGEVG